MESVVKQRENASVIVRVLPWSGAAEEEKQRLLMHEWLVTNGLGGYSSGTVSGVVTRRYHGLLVAGLPREYGRMVMLTGMEETIMLPDDRCVRLGGEERAECRLQLHGAGYLTEFRLEWGIPVWRYEIEGYVLERRIFMPHRQNTVYVQYRMLSGPGAVSLQLRPAMHFRHHEAPVNTPLSAGYTLTVENDRYEFFAREGLPRLRMTVLGGRHTFTIEQAVIKETIYRTEESRGYEARGDLWSPGYFQVELPPGQETAVAASTEGWETVFAQSPSEAWDAEQGRRGNLVGQARPGARQGIAGELTLAADQFVFVPPGRRADLARARASGEDVRSVIAGYHWFMDWGRDTMIGLEGLTLLTGRLTEAEWILRTFGSYVRDGLIPNMFPEGHEHGIYNTADASLWFFHAVDRYLELGGDRSILEFLVPKLLDIVDHYRAGTVFGIGVDPADGLVRQGAEGFALTWMDAKVEDWVVTPRRGKAVEINALWYNALRLLAQWAGPADAHRLAGMAEQAKDSFNRRFWYPAGGYLYDIVDGESGNDASLRPNQILAVSLRHPVLDPYYWEPVVETVRNRLLTPVGLRSLAPGDPQYKVRYYGDRRTRDAAYHQGTVWAWLIGPFIDAWLMLHPNDRAGARRFLEGFGPHLNEAGVGTISEIFDADPPFTPRGCIAQAWSVGEVLRCLVKTAEQGD